MKNEADVKKKVKKLLDKHEWFWFMPPANAYGKAGISDIIALRDGVFLAVETKFGTNKPTALQIGFLNSIMAQSGFGFVVNDRNLSFFQQWLEAFDRAQAAQVEQREVDPVDGSLMLNAMKVLGELIA